MLSYQHDYHAGNVSELVKHLAVVLLARYMTQKDKPLFLMDTHAGSGVYHLNDKRALKTGEASEGILSFWPNQKILSAVSRPYLEVIKAYNTDNVLKIYPGTFAILQYFMRSSDRLWGCELHREAFAALTKLSRGKHQIRQVDGLQQLIAMMPPQERRGLVVIDPSYELKSDYVDVVKTLKEACRRFSTGVYCLWYPILAAGMHKKMLQQLKALQLPSTLSVEMGWKNSILRMQGCGLWIVNPPYSFSKDLQLALQDIEKALPKLAIHYTLS